MSRERLIHVITLFICLCFFHNAYAEKKLRVVTEEFPPYKLAYPNDAYPPTMMVKALLEKAGLSNQVEVYPWARAYKIAKNDPNILIFSISQSTKRLPQFEWIGPLFHLEGNSYFLALKEREDVVAHRLDDLKQYRVCVDVDNVTYERLLKKGFIPGKNLFPLRPFLLLLEPQPNSGEIDKRKVISFLSSACDVITPIGGQVFEKIENKMLKTVFISERERLPLYLAMSLGSDVAIRNKTLKAYRALKTDGTLYRYCLSGTKEQAMKSKCEVVKPGS